MSAALCIDISHRAAGLPQGVLWRVLLFDTSLFFFSLRHETLPPFCESYLIRTVWASFPLTITICCSTPDNTATPCARTLTAVSSSNPGKGTVLCVFTETAAGALSGQGCGSPLHPHPHSRVDCCPGFLGNSLCRGWTRSVVFTPHLYLTCRLFYHRQWFSLYTVDVAVCRDCRVRIFYYGDLFFLLLFFEVFCLNIYTNIYPVS